MNNQLFLILILLTAIGCTTSGDIRREKMINQSQEVVADQGTKISDVEERISILQGKVEEIGHLTNQVQKNSNREILKTLEQITEQVKVIDKKVEEDRERLSALINQVSSNKNFIGKVTKTLGKMAHGGKPSKKQKKGVKKSNYTLGIESFNKRRYKSAKVFFNQAIKSKRLPKKRRLISAHYLCITEFKLKDYNNALILLSKFYTKYPRSSYSPNVLLHLGKSFEKIGNKEQAKNSYRELVNNFPKSRHVKSAKKSLKRL